MMTIKELEYPSYSSSATGPRISWRAILAGAASSVALSCCLGLLGLGLGAVQAPAAAVLTGLSIRASVWLIVTSAIAFYAGGWACSRMAGVGRFSDSVLHGLASWATATVALLLLFPVIGSVFNGTAIRLAPAAAVKFGWIGFLLTAIDAAAACVGARDGARLLMPVPVEKYHRTRTEAVTAER